MRISTATLFMLSTAVSVKGQEYSPAATDMKCQFESNERLFRYTGVTIEECYQLCYDTENCKYFSIGVRSYVGVCMGCTADAVFEAHDGFDAYKMEITQDFPTASPIQASACLKDGDTFTTNGCDYDSFVKGLDDFIADQNCDPHDAIAVLKSTFPNSSEYIVKSLCASAWDQVPTSTFDDIDSRFTDSFMQEYIDGDTFLNHETGTFQNTVEGNNIDIFRDAEATNTVLQEIPSLANCGLNSIMCCFGRDRQPNDNNGNCKDPIESRCVDADPADNSNLCWTDSDIENFTDHFTFPDKSEGPIHCHGLAWAEDENSFTAQLRFNNLFFVSLYDHMYTRGYVETMVDTDNISMCNCIEDMPVVSRADCTQVDVNQDFTVTYSNGEFSVTKTGDMNVKFNSCQGINPSNGRRTNNDLGSYVYRLNKEGKISDETMEGVFDTLVGYESPNDNQNEPACEATYLETFGEDYPINVANLKCPHQNSERLFRTDDNAPLTLEECQDLCYETQFCEYFSLGVSTKSAHKGVCIGCTSQAVLEPHRGFNVYEMTSTQNFPTSAPTPESEYFDKVANGKKCPQNNTRLFRTPDNEPLTRPECYEYCYNTEGCEYFSLGEEPHNDAFVGVCIGCTADSILEDHDGFNAFVMEIKPPTTAPTDVSTLFQSVALNKKCPFSNRLFRTHDNDPLTKYQCYEKCNSDPDCEYFTFGESDNLREAWKGLCMGCSSDLTLSDHTGFNMYEILP
uniref:Apple domain-containing protein n=2 Tax=Corethron hystrix TaxID=216773 RepID=A0A7S1FWG6_9STRA|mmetsp:Transcript_37491/g.87420  ORF Transcript_37491/g.87420 Transcript_37491/m.87420 type:complete len:738 (+) Transcript_37491:44-2257(+)